MVIYEAGNSGLKVREFVITFPLTLPSSGRVEEDKNKFSLTLTPKIQILVIWYVLLKYVYQCCWTSEPKFSEDNG